MLSVATEAELDVARAWRSPFGWKV